MIGPEALCFDVVAPADPLTTVPPPVATVPTQPLSGVVRAQEDRAIRRVLAEAPSRRAAAARLGISERTLRYKLAGMASRASASLANGIGGGIGGSIAMPSGLRLQ